MSISRYEYQFMNWVFDIMQNGFYQKNERTGIATRRISHMVLAVDCATECPLLKSKHTFWKSSVEEAFWIFRDGSNDIHDLRPHIWDDWADENGIVQKTYGYQIKKYDQVNRVLNDLAKDSSTRRAVIDLWNNADLPEMSITPCVYTSTWDVVDNKLNVLVVSRSCDILVGGVFNIFQYTVLNKLFAKHLGVEPGILTFVAADAHIYENQFEGCKQMIGQYRVLLSVGQIRDRYFASKKEEDPEEFTNETFLKTLEALANGSLDDDEFDVASVTFFAAINEYVKTLMEKDPTFDFVKVYDCEPKLEITSEGTNFFDTTIDDVKVEDYYHMQRIDFPVAV